MLWGMQNPEQCPSCGRFIELDADGFYGHARPDDDASEVLQFCNERCCDRYYAKQRLPSSWPVEEMMLHDEEA